jgi:hypothetical protein
MDYTPSQVATALRSPHDADHDLLLDLSLSLPLLDGPTKRLLYFWAIGYSSRQALQRAGIGGNSSRRVQEALRRLTRLVNGGGGG